MSQFVEVKTAELIGLALDWAVAQVEGVSCTPHTIKRFYRPSTDWAQGGPLIEMHRIKVIPPRFDGSWHAGWMFNNGGLNASFATWDGETPLIAACRAIVDAKLGDAVNIPKDLLVEE